VSSGDQQPMLVVEVVVVVVIVGPFVQHLRLLFSCSM